MTNYEKYKDEIDEMFDNNKHIAINKDTNELANCSVLPCDDCLFSSYHNGINCRINSIRWLSTEYVKPEVDWSKIPIDTPVLVSDKGVKHWFNSYFAGVDEIGRPLVYPNGRTSWSNQNYYKPLEQCNYIKLAEVK